MDYYAVIPLLACTISAATAAHLWTAEPDNRRMWPIAGISALGAFWAFCEVLANQAEDPATALFWLRMALAGSIPLGPMALHALSVVCDQYSPRVRAAVWALHASGIGIIGFALFSDAVVTTVVPTWWGWGARPGSGMILAYLLIMGAAFAGYRVFRGQYTLEEERTGAPLVTLSLAVPVVIASLTDVILPALAVESVPRFGSAAVAFIGVIRAYSFLRHGDSMLIPEGITAKALQALPDGVMSVAVDGRIRTANDRMAELIGSPSSDLVGAPVERFLPAAVLTASREVRDYACSLTNSSGEAIDVSISTSTREMQGQAAGTVVIVRDVREVANLRSRLMLSGRMAAVGELAAGIAHEVNNPIAYVRSNLMALREHADVIDKALRQLPNWREMAPIVSDCEDIIDESLEGIDRAAGIIRDVREFSHAGEGERRPTDLAQVIEQSLRVARIQIRKSVSVEVNVDELPQVECDPQRIKQVLVNLLVNAGHAVSEQGRIEITGELDGDRVAVRIKDDGCGIPQADLERIFDPFFTTKPVGVGTGLGLAINFGILKDHGGSIDVESSEGTGTTFTFHLPRATDDA